MKEGRKEDEGRKEGRGRKKEDEDGKDVEGRKAGVSFILRMIESMLLRASAVTTPRCANASLKTCRVESVTGTPIISLNSLALSDDESCSTFMNAQRGSSL